MCTKVPTYAPNNVYFWLLNFMRIINVVTKRTAMAKYVLQLGPQVIHLGQACEQHK